MPEFLVKTFDALEKRELFDILHARQDVFIVEQGSPYPDIDSDDLSAIHIFCYREGEIAAVARILYDGDSAHFGRVLVTKRFRGTGLGRRLISFTLETIRSHFPGQMVKISAQEYLIPFYRSFGFEPVSKPYDDAGVMHVDMRFG